MNKAFAKGEVAGGGTEVGIIPQEHLQVRHALNAAPALNYQLLLTTTTNN